MATAHSEQEIRKALQDFYKDWLIWASEGGKVIPPFGRNDGLCVAITQWAHHQDLMVSMAYDMKSYLKDDFINDGLDRLYPFGEEDFDQRWMDGTMHKCPKRFDFVYRMAKRSI